MRAFVTGSTGLLGSNLVQALVEGGHRVRALARSVEKAERLLGDLDVEIVQGDMEDVAGFAQHLAGCDVLFHAAAYFREYFSSGDHWRRLERINVRGTIDLLTAAEAQGVQRTIYVSSSGVIGPRSDGTPSDEHVPPGPANLQNLYFKSKVIAEERIQEWLQEHTMPVVLILPVAMAGPRDAAPTSMGQMVIDFVNGNLPAVPPGGFSLVDARDVAAAMLAAVDRGRSGERYIINNRYYSIAEVLSLLAKITGRSSPPIRLPFPLALAYAHVSEFSSRFTGGDPLVTVNAVRTLQQRVRFTDEKARRELGHQPRPFEDTLRDTVGWFQEQGRIQLKAQPAG